ncbi:hypothetical protein [Crossiella sp. NPDC003009]
MTEQVPPSSNTVNGPVAGNSVQAGMIQGGVHFYLNQPALEPPLPLIQAPAVPPVRQGPRKRVLLAKFLGRWLWALLPLGLISGAVAGLGNLLAGPGPLPPRLLADLIVLPVAGLVLWVWSMAADRRFRDLLTLGLDKLTPQRVAGLTDRQLTVFAVCAAVFCVLGFGQEMLPPDPLRPRPDGHMAVVFLALLALLAFRQLRHRKKCAPAHTRLPG